MREWCNKFKLGKSAFVKRDLRLLPLTEAEFDADFFLDCESSSKDQERCDQSDDRELRKLLSETPTDGHIQLSFFREPSFFAAASVEGCTQQTIICRDMLTGGRIVAMGSRSTRLCWVGDELTRTGYLSGLRIHPDCRGVGLLAHGYRLLRQMHDRDPLPVYLTTITVGNERAWRLLTSRRAGLPEYRYLGDYLSFAIPLAQKVVPVELPIVAGKYQLQRAKREDLAELIAFWRLQRKTRDYFPDYRETDFGSDCGMMRGLSPEDILIARCRSEIVGTLAVWDQMGFRQSVVHGYGTWLGRIRPLINLWARSRGQAGLPALGKPLPLMLAALPAFRDGHADCIPLLLRTALHLCAGGEHCHLLIGMSEDDPLRAALPKRAGTVYRTRICLVRWDDAPTMPVAQQRTPYLEVGSL